MMNDFENRLRNDKIHGWLTFFLVTTGFGVLFSLILFFSKITINDYDFGLQNEHVNYQMSAFGVVCDMIFIVGIVILGIMTIRGFFKQVLYQRKIVVCQ